ncbi:MULTISPECIES: DUF2528 family protein [Acinetobacter]|uniref:DUF2528 family protein n=1 Tax=Acinetobacter higginsii TaxID=70347 RepID=N9SPJ3_9GAMM|nr:MULTISPECIES: DUF2528 family protein [Acinetobacter]ENX53242.1 hypothetical protein F902_04111 [Acinetobacter higginsii]
MQNDSNVENKQAEIPVHLQCAPRTYKVAYDKWSDVCDLEFTVVIKCTDEMLHEHNNFWSGYKDRLNENNGDIVAVILKMIGKAVFFACFEGKERVGIPPFKWGVNTIFQEEGWYSDCFEITKLYFDSHVSGDDFEINPVTVEG